MICLGNKCQWIKYSRLVSPVNNVLSGSTMWKWASQIPFVWNDFQGRMSNWDCWHFQNKQWMSLTIAPTGLFWDKLVHHVRWLIPQSSNCSLVLLFAHISVAGVWIKVPSKAKFLIYEQSIFLHCQNCNRVAWRQIWGNVIGYIRLQIPDKYWSRLEMRFQKVANVHIFLFIGLFA